MFIAHRYSLFVAALAIQVLLSPLAAVAQDARSDLQALNQQLVEAYRGGRYADGVRLAEEAYQLATEAFGRRDPDSLTSMKNLAELYRSQGRYGEAEPLFVDALALTRDVLGDNHPDTLVTTLNAAVFYGASDRPGDAARLLRQMQPALLARLAAEIYSTEDVTVRSALVASQSSFQDVALSLAIAFPDESAARRVAAVSLLRFKGLLAEEEAYLAKLGRSSEDPRVIEAAANLADKRRELAVAYTNTSSDPERIKKLLREVNTAELALGRVSRAYEDQLQVRKASLEDLQGSLPDGSVLVEFRKYWRVEFAKSELAEERWAAVVIRGLESIKVVDLGEISGTADVVAIVASEGENADPAARVLHDRLIAVLDLPVDVTRLYIAPDDVLNLLSFHRLMDEDRKYLAQQYEIRQIQTARDLLRPDHAKPAIGLLALGGIDFDQPEVQVAGLAPTDEDSDRGLMRGEAARLGELTADAFRSGFAPLPGTSGEIDRIARLYRQARPQESVEIWTKSEASEARLAARTTPPRVLHLATHGFYRPSTGRTDRPMLLSGITLAGANLALKEPEKDGILYAIEAQNLNLEGTELVILSACETAQGTIAYGEGVYGLARALRTAGARNVLVTLRGIDDGSAPQFMERFYINWLGQDPKHASPAKALQQTQQYYIDRKPDFDWSPYVIVGG